MSAPAAARTGSDEPPTAWDGDLVTVAHRFNTLEAELLRGRLAADGIPTLLGDAHTVQTDTLLTVALGGVRVMVPASYAPRARRAIAAVESGEFMLAEGAEAIGEPESESQPAGAPGLSRLAFATMAIVVLGLLAAFAP